MASTITIFDAFVFDKSGLRTGGGTNNVTAHATITGSGDPTTEIVSRTVAVPAGERVRIYDRTTDGGFDIFRLQGTVDVTLYWQVGSPADDSTAKTNLTWANLQLLVANGAFRFQSDYAETNSSAASAAGDTADAPTNADDGGTVDGRIQAIEVINRGTTDGTVTVTKLN
jgi:hypothetical protein